MRAIVLDMRWLFAWTPSWDSSRQNEEPTAEGNASPFSFLPSPLGRVPCPVSELSVLFMVGPLGLVLPRIACRGGPFSPPCAIPAPFLCAFLDLLVPKPCRSDSMTPLDSESVLDRLWCTLFITGNNDGRTPGCAPSSAVCQCHQHLPRTCGGCSRSRPCSLGTAALGDAHAQRLSPGQNIPCNGESPI